MVVVHAWRSSSLSNHLRTLVLPETGPLFACSLWVASECQLRAEQTCIEALTSSLEEGIPLCLLGSSIFLPPQWLERATCLCLNPDLWFQSGSATAHWALSWQANSAFPSPPCISMDLRIHGSLTKNKGASCFSDTSLKFRSGKLAQEGNSVCCS